MTFFVSRHKVAIFKRLETGSDLNLKKSITGRKNLLRARKGSNPWARVGEGPQQITTGENASVTSAVKICLQIQYSVLLNFPPTNNLHSVQGSSCSIDS